MGISVGIGNYIGNNKVLGGITPKPKLVASYRTYGKRNADTDRSTLKDLTGNGHDIKLFNFSYSYENGYGKHCTQFDKYKLWDNERDVTITYVDANKISLQLRGSFMGDILFELSTTDPTISPNIDNYKNTVFYIKATSNTLTKENHSTDPDFPEATIGWYNYYPSSVQKPFQINAITAINPLTIEQLVKTSSISIQVQLNNLEQDKIYDLTLELIPQYSEGLIFNGIDNYGYCDNFPIFEKKKGYTVIALRKWLQLLETPNLQRFLTNYTNSKNTAFIMESGSSSKDNQTASWGPTMGINTIPNLLEADLVVYQKSYEYNGKTLRISTEGSDVGSNELTLGNLQRGNGAGFANMVFYALEIYDGDLPIEEIELIKKRMLDEWYEKSSDPELMKYQALWTCNGKSNYDADKNIPNLIDSDNPLKLSNFAFAGNSGYNYYALDFRQFDTVGARCELTRTFDSVRVTKILTDANPKFEHINPLANYPAYRIQVSGLKSGASIKPFAATLTNPLMTITRDGKYYVPKVERAEVAWYGYLIEGYANNEACDITIKLLPTGAEGLYFDGVDDYIQSTKQLPGLESEYTVVGELDLSARKENRGILKWDEWYWYSLNIYIGEKRTSVADKTVHGFNSKGLIVFDDSSIQGNSGPNSSLSTIATYTFPLMRFNSLAIIPRILTESQIRIVYQYLKTTKAKNR